jgi:hypothetical protein
VAGRGLGLSTPGLQGHVALLIQSHRRYPWIGQYWHNRIPFVLPIIVSRPRHYFGGMPLNFWQSTPFDLLRRECIHVTTIRPAGRLDKVRGEVAGLRLL